VAPESSRLAGFRRAGQALGSILARPARSARLADGKHGMSLRIDQSSDENLKTLAAWLAGQN
jgi:hypothetical protein